MCIEDPHTSEAQHASAINLAAGIWLFSSPWIFGLYDGAEWNSFCVAIPLAVLSAIRLAVPDKCLGASCINLFLGMWAIASPWLVGFTDQPKARWNLVAVGFLVVLFASRSIVATLRIHQEGPLTPRHR